MHTQQSNAASEAQKTTSHNDTTQNTKTSTIQTKQGKKPTIQAKGFGGRSLQPVQTKQTKKPPIQAKGFGGNTLQPIQRQATGGGLPNTLKTNMERMSGTDLSDVKVHYNSDKPAQLQAHAYAQGSDIHLGAGQEKHLPHEAWHVVQQKQGRVQATNQMKGEGGNIGINDSPALEREADQMGAKAVQRKAKEEPTQLKEGKKKKGTTQLKEDKKKKGAAQLKVVQIQGDPLFEELKKQIRDWKLAVILRRQGQEIEEGKLVDRFQEQAKDDAKTNGEVIRGTLANELIGYIPGLKVPGLGVSMGGPELKALHSLMTSVNTNTINNAVSDQLVGKIQKGDTINIALKQYIEGLETKIMWKFHSSSEADKKLLIKEVSMMVDVAMNSLFDRQSYKQKIYKAAIHEWFKTTKHALVQFREWLGGSGISVSNGISSTHIPEFKFIDRVAATRVLVDGQPKLQDVVSGAFDYLLFGDRRHNGMEAILNDLTEWNANAQGEPGIDKNTILSIFSKQSAIAGQIKIYNSVVGDPRHQLKDNTYSSDSDGSNKKSQYAFTLQEIECVDEYGYNWYKGKRPGGLTVQQGKRFIPFSFNLNTGEKIKINSPVFNFASNEPLIFELWVEDAKQGKVKVNPFKDESINERFKHNKQDRKGTSNAGTGNYKVYFNLPTPSGSHLYIAKFKLS